MRNRKSATFATGLTKNPNSSSSSAPTFISDVNLPAPKIRKEICGGVSAVSFWRWRHDPKMGCPPLTEINGRLYGSREQWLNWWARQKRVG
jgi:hypothetical protein